MMIKSYSSTKLRAEQTVLGAMLLDKIAIVTAEDILHDTRRLLRDGWDYFEAILNLK